MEAFGVSLRDFVRLEGFKGGSARTKLRKEIDAALFALYEALRREGLRADEALVAVGAIIARNPDHFPPEWYREKALRHRAGIEALLEEPAEPAPTPAPARLEAEAEPGFRARVARRLPERWQSSATRTRTWRSG